MTPTLGQYWHGVNPWRDHITYVPLDELARALAGGTVSTLRGVERMDAAWLLNHWGQYGPKLDAYILPQARGIHSCGVRFGPKGEDYLSPHNSNPDEVRFLLKEYSTTRNAWDELIEELWPHETVEAIVFGQFGWGSKDDLAYGEDAIDPPIPYEIYGVPLTLEEAYPFMQSWHFAGGFGSPKAYATYIWTSLRVMWVHEYDGSTSLNSMPRNPTRCHPLLSNP